VIPFKGQKVKGKDDKVTS